MNITGEKVFEILGVYFTNCYWTHLWKAADEAYQDEAYPSITEAYRDTIEKYQRAFCGKDEPGGKANRHYLEIIKDINRNFCEFLGTTKTIVGMLDLICQFLLPREYYKSLGRQDSRKDAVVREVLSKTVTRFTIYILQNEVDNVVKLRAADRNIKQGKNEKDKKQLQEQVQKIMQTWKVRFIDIINNSRTEFCNILIAKSNGIDITKPEEIPSVPREAFDRLQAHMSELLKEKALITQEHNKMVRYVALLKKAVKDKELLVESMQNTINEMQQKNRFRRPYQPRPPGVPGVPSVPGISSTAPPGIPPSTSIATGTAPPAPAPPVAEITNNAALQQLEAAKFPGEEVVDIIPPVAVEEAGDLNSENQLVADE